MVQGSSSIVDFVDGLVQGEGLRFFGCGGFLSFCFLYMSCIPSDAVLLASS